MTAIPRKKSTLLAILAAGCSVAALAQGAREDGRARSAGRAAPGTGPARDDAPRGAIRGASSVSIPGLGDLPAGKALTIVFNASVDAGPFAAGKDDLSNQGTVSGGNIPATLTDDPAFPGGADPTLTPLDAAPDFNLSVDDGGVSTTPGGVVAYTFGFANNGTQGATGVTLSTTVPAHTAFNAGASTAGWSCIGVNCTFTVGGLGATSAGSATFAVTVNNPVPAGVNAISITGSIADDLDNGADPTPANNTDGDTTPLNAQPDLAMNKDDGAVSVSPGGTVVYTLGYSNGGNQGAVNVVLTETVPLHTTFNAGASTAGWSCANGSPAGTPCTLAVAGELAGAGAAGSANFAVTLVDPVPGGVSNVSNTASVADDGANGTDPTPANNTDTELTPINGAPDLGLLDSDGGGSTTPGAVVVYALSFSNTGNRGATGVTISTSVPTGTTFNAGSSTSGWSCANSSPAGTPCVFNVGSVAVGASAPPVNFAVSVINPAAAGLDQIDHSATIADDGTNGTDPNPTNNAATDFTPLVAQPDLTIDKDDLGASVVPGGTVAYTLAYANAGNQNATGVVLNETVPANTTFNAGASTAGWSCANGSPGGTPCTLSVGALTGAGGTGSATFAVTLVNPVPAGVTVVTNTGSINDDNANGGDPTPGNNSDTETTPIVAAPELGIVKSDAGASAVPGTPLTYTLNDANAGTRGATGVVLSETVPPDTTFNATLSTAGWSCANGAPAGTPCTLAIGSVPASGSGSSGSASFVVNPVNPMPAGANTIDNTASIADDGANGTDPNPANNTDTEPTPVDAQPDLTLNKDDGGATTHTGGTIAYTLAYTNAGNQDATGVALNETVPTHTVFNPGASTAGWSCVPNNNAGSACTLSIGALAGAGGTGSATFALNVNTVVPAGTTQILNTASANDDGANGTDPTPANNTDTEATPLQLTPDLRLTKTDNRVAVHAGQVVTYVLSYDNIGSQDATGVSLSETVPDGTTFFDPPGTSGWSCAHGSPGGTSCTFNVAGPVVVGAAAQTKSFRVKVLTGLPLGTVISNAATVVDDETNGPDGNPGNNTAVDNNTVVTPKGDMNRPAARDTDETLIARTDLVFQNEFSNRIVVWFMDFVSGASTQGGGFFTTPLAADPGYRVVGTADFARISAEADTDGLTDLLLRNTTAGDLQVWLMDGMQRGQLLPVVPAVAFPSLGFEVGATGDMDGDGRADIVWYNKNSGVVVVWKMDGRTQVLAGTGVTNPSTLPSNAWKVTGSGDFNNDGNADLLLQNGATGEIRLWLMDGARNVIGSPTVGTPAATDVVVAVGDYDADMDPDIVLRDSATGALRTWFMSGTTPAGAPVSNNPATLPGTLAQALSWRVVGPR